MLFRSLICKMFNMYMSNAKEDLSNFEFTIPKFFDKDKFKININILPNKLTREYLKEDERFEYVFKVILGSLNKPRKKPIGVFTDKTLVLFNNFVEGISDRIDEILSKYRESELRKKGLIDFSQYIEIDYDEDADGEVYPDVFSEFESPDTKKKKGIEKKGFEDEFGFEEEGDKKTDLEQGLEGGEMEL